MTEPTWPNFDAWHDHDLSPFEIDGVTLIMTCAACPEQYDVFIGPEQIGYLRLRWGRFYAAYPNHGGEIVYDIDLGNDLDGCFSPEERKKHLPLAVKALLERHNNR